ncbi:MAG: dUTP diphosphatase [Oscillospiraceae bacterium]|nr:dUTP diphosphatase [Oscillospiraceae bacterium]
MNINIKKLRENAIIPTRGSEYAAGYDLYACLEKPIKVEPGETVKVPTGISMEVPVGYAGMIFARSGLATKKGLAPANKVGVCDSDYRGEYIVALYNHSNQTITINSAERIAQLVIMPFLEVEFNEVNELNDTARGSGGFGSTGK